MGISLDPDASRVNRTYALRVLVLLGWRIIVPLCLLLWLGQLHLFLYRRGLYVFRAVTRIFGLLGFEPDLIGILCCGVLRTLELSACALLLLFGGVLIH